MWNMRVTVIEILIRMLEQSQKAWKKKNGGIGSQRKNQNQQDHSIVEISLDT